MKSKQVVGIVIAGLVFAFVGATSVATNYLFNNALNSADKKISSVFESSDSSQTPYDEFVAVIDIKGTIADNASSGYSLSYDHEGTLEYIDELMENDLNKAILLDVDSPGGYVYESDEMYEKLMEYKEVTGRPIYAYFEKTACSGAYYISMAADEIYMNKTGTTGSIGVIMSLINTSELYNKLGIKEINIVSGKNKGMGSMGSELTQEQKDIYQSMIDESYGYFVDVVEQGRNIERNRVLELADGRTYTAKQALDAGLIDKISNYDNALKDISTQLGNEDIEFYIKEKPVKDFISSIFNMSADLKGTKNIEAIEEYINSKGNGVPMYYAE